MAEGDNDFQVRIVPIENGYVVKRQGKVWYFDNAKSAREKVDSLIVEWEKELGPFQGD